MNIIVCYATCWACKFDHHFNPPCDHRWADADDIQDALENGRPDPSGSCACACAQVDG